MKTSEYKGRDFASSQGSFLANAKVSSIIYLLIFFLITVSGSRHFVDAGLQNSIEAIGYLVLIITVTSRGLREGILGPGDWLFASLVILLLLPGFMHEGLTLYRKTAFLLAAIVLVGTTIVSRGQMANQDEIVFAIAGVVAGVVFSFALSLYDGRYMGALGSFDGGILYKNYFAGDILCVLIGASCLSPFKAQMTVGRLLIICASISLIGISGSKGAVLLAGFFVLALHLQSYYDINSRMEKALLLLLIIGISIPLLFVLFDWISDVETYQYRVRGLKNYWAFVSGDVRRIVFGSSELLYSGRAGYAWVFRDLVGWDGSIEFAWLNVLMKHGLLGIVAYLAVFGHYFARLKQCNGERRRLAVAILLTLLLSSFVESYVETMHSVVGPFCYMLASGLSGNKLSERDDVGAGTL